MTQFLVSIGMVLALSGCSLNPFAPTARVQVQIESSAEESPFQLDNALQPGLLSAPAAVSSFNCLGVNVMGPGIANTEVQNGAAPPPYNPGAGQYCSYGGITSPPIPNSGGSKEINLTVLTGGGRIFQIIGIMDGGSGLCSFNGPLSQHNSGEAGNDEIFELGHAFVDVFQATTISVASTWASLGTTALREQRKVNCGNQWVPTVSGRKTTCMNTSPAAPTNGGAGLTISEYQTEDAVFSYAECAAGTGFRQWAEYDFDTTGIANLSNYTYIKVLWKGRAGYNAGGCSMTGQTAGGGQLYIYRYVPAGWVPLQSPTDGTYQTISTGTGFVNVADYIDGTGKIYVGMQGANIPSGAECSSVHTDLLTVRLAR